MVRIIGAVLAGAFVLLVACGAGQAAGNGGFIWIEAETPAARNFEFRIDTRKAAIYSDGKCFFHAVKGAALEKLPTEGLLLRYDFDVPVAGTYRLWTRIGMEWVRADMDWRIDDRPWRTFAHTELTTNLMQVSVWNELAWGDCGTVKIDRGAHALNIRFRTPNRDKILFALDCFAFTDPGFIPEGRLKPGETYDAEADRTAAKHVYRFPEERTARGSGVRTELPLHGPWQLARYDDLNMDDGPLEPVKALPQDYPFRWMGVSVPGDVWKQRPELYFGHRLVYRTRIDVPARFKGRSFFLHFAGTCYVAGVFVNGRYCGGRRSVLVPWDCDITRAVSPGRENVLQVVIKSAFYCYDPGKKQDGAAGSIHERRNLPHTHWRYGRWADAVYPSSKGEGSGMQVGIVNPCTLVVAGAARVADVFVRTSVAKRRLDATVEVANPGREAITAEVVCAAVHDRSNEIEKAFPPATVRVPAGDTVAVDIGGAWSDAKPWWPAEKMGDLPDVYRMRTTLRANGVPIDVREDTFGFREITIKGRDFLLNGVPWRFYNWIDVPNAKKVRDHQEWLRLYHAQNDGSHRFSWDHSRVFGHREQAIEYLDRYGIPNRCSTCIDGMFITQDLLNPVVWKNWEDHVRQVVRAYRNHPSIMHWSVGNEVMLVNAHNTRRRDYLDLEKKMACLLRAAREVDPTRESYEDGAGDLGGLGPINNVHYHWRWYPDVPARLYDYVTGRPAKRPGRRRETFMWSGGNPFMGGEVWYYAGRPSRIAWFGGPEVYREMRLSHLAAGRYARMGVEGARWQNCAGMHLWTGVLPGGAEKAFARRAVFVREYNRCFFPGAEFRRTIKVFNDSRHPGSLTLRWQTVFGDRVAARGEKEYALAPGMNEEDSISVRLPESDRRLDGEFQLRLYAGDALIFEDARPVSVLPRPHEAPVVAADSLAVCDPSGSVIAWLKARNVSHQVVAGPGRLPPKAQTILLGPNALTARNRNAWAKALKRVVFAGGTAIVLEQTTPLAGKNLPVEGIEPGRPGRRQRVRMGEFAGMGGHFGSISHPVAPAHPVLAGLQSLDFFCWAGDETNYRLSYAVPPGGAVSLVQAGSELTLAPMMELPVGSGSYLLSQMLIGAKLSTEPVADRLLHNILVWACERTATKPHTAAVVSDGDRSLENFLGGIGLDYNTFAVPAEALKDDGGVVVIKGSAANASWLRRNRSAVRRFCEKGGWIMLVAPGKRALAALNEVVGVRQRMRRFRTEAVRLRAPDDALVTGITDRDFSQRGYRMIASWMKLYRTSNQIFTSVVDASTNIAAFGRGAGGKLTDGMTKDVFWTYTAYYPSDGSRPITFRFDREETFAGMQIWTSGAYYRPKDIRVIFDDDEADALDFTLADHDNRQDLKWKPRPARKVVVRMLSHYPAESKKPLVTFDEIRLFRVLPPEVQQRVQALTTPAGIVKYPVGDGGIILNCLNWREKMGKPKDKREERAFRDIARSNVQKKRAIMSALLRNMGAAFRPPATGGPDVRELLEDRGK